MKTWGYIRQAVLMKLDLPIDEADQLDYLNRFSYYANEAMTQICTIKPKRNYFEVEVTDDNEKQSIWNNLVSKYNVSYTNIIDRPDLPLYSNEIQFWKEWESYHFVGDPITVEPDFIGFNDDVPKCQIKNCKNEWTKPFEAHDSDFEYLGYNKIVCKHYGRFLIPYNARWFTFSTTMDENTELDIPDDVLDCIPSYVVSQLFKIDDEYKASVYRNEYEMFLARIDDTDYRNSTTIEIGGDW